MTLTEELRAALAAVMDSVDYTKGACSPTEMVGAVLPKEVIGLARKALSRKEKVSKGNLCEPPKSSP